MTSQLTFSTLSWKNDNRISCSRYTPVHKSTKKDLLISGFRISDCKKARELSRGFDLNGIKQWQLISACIIGDCEKARECSGVMTIESLLTTFEVSCIFEGVGEMALIGSSLNKNHHII